MMNNTTTFTDAEARQVREQLAQGGTPVLLELAGRDRSTQVCRVVELRKVRGEAAYEARPHMLESLQPGWYRVRRRVWA